jgi:putative aldouronate transport system permease protein
MQNNKVQLFDYINMVVLLLIAILAVYPFVNIMAISLSDGSSVAAGKVFLFPKGWNLETYKYILSSPRLGVASGLYNSIFYTVFGSLFAICLTFITAYPLSRTRLKGRHFIILIFLFTWVFEAGIIPNYIINNALGLVDSRWIMIIPGAINTFLLIITRSFMDTIPVEIEETAFIDGANDIQIMYKLFVPLCKPIIATIGIFYSVTIWNQFLVPMIYLQSQNLQPITVVLYSMIISGGKDATTFENLLVNGVELTPQNLHAAAIFLAVIPILFVYPFAQKYFTKGMLLGAVKG